SNLDCPWLADALVTRVRSTFVTISVACGALQATVRTDPLVTEVESTAVTIIRACRAVLNRFERLALTGGVAEVIDRTLVAIVTGCTSLRLMPAEPFATYVCGTRIPVVVTPGAVRPPSPG